MAEPVASPSICIVPRAGHGPPLADLSCTGQLGTSAEASIAAPRATATGTVAVITRTKNRPLLVRRALESICQQTFKRFQWVIVNDGGELDAIDAIAAEAEARGVDTLVIHLPASIGMEAASNKGIHAVDSQYIVIHDDDDSWQPAFLEVTTDFLRQNPSYGGVVTQSMRVDEEIMGDCVRVLSKYPFNRTLTNVYLIDLLGANSFPPISFLYKREAFRAVGDYDPTLPVLGDWDFNIRFLQRYNIGVVPELLANYHHRVNVQGGAAYENTVIAGVSQHLLYDAVIRNRMLRQDLAEGRFGVGCLMSVLRWHRNLAADQNWIGRMCRLLLRAVGRLIGPRRLLHWLGKTGVRPPSCIT